MINESPEVDEIWANYLSQNIFDKIGYFPTIGGPFDYTVSVRTLFGNPKAKAVKEIRKFAEKWSYDVIFYRSYREISSALSRDSKKKIFNIPFLRRGDLIVKLYKKGVISQKVLEDI